MPFAAPFAPLVVVSDAPFDTVSEEPLGAPREVPLGEWGRAAPLPVAAQTARGARWEARREVPLGEWGRAAPLRCVPRPLPSPPSGSMPRRSLITLRLSAV